MLQVSMFLSEGTLMYGLIHKHILPVLAANTDPCLPPLLVYPSVAHGNLKRSMQLLNQSQLLKGIIIYTIQVKAELNILLEFILPSLQC